MALSPEEALLSIVLVGYAIWWAYDLRKGSVVRRTGMAFHIAIYVLLFLWVLIVGTVFVVTLGGSTNILVLSLFPLWALFTGVFYVATRTGYRLGLQKMVVDRTATGEWRYRGLAAFPLMWLVLWFSRLGLEGTFLGGYSIFIPANGFPRGVPWWTFLGVGLVIEALYFVSFGMMMGITLAVWKHYRRLKEGASLPPRATVA